MTTDTPYTIDLEHFTSLFPSAARISVSGKFCVVDLRYDKSLDILRHPFRFDGFLIFFCLSGNMTMMINLRKFEVTEDSLFINMPGNILQITGDDIPDKDELRFIAIAMTSGYVSGLKADIGRLMMKGTMLLENPFYRLNGEEKSIASQYLHLTYDIMHSSLPHKHESMDSLISSLFYLSGDVIERNIKDTPSYNRRSRELFDKFILLVSEHHCRNHTVGFYAERMCITPKYLSRVVKEASGKSAPEWISAYVIVEARNMLRYSRLPTKVIAEKTGFNNIMSFNKYFKSHTGTSPVKYRKGK